MTTVSRAPVHQPRRATGVSPGGPPRTLPDERILLLSQVTARSRDVLAAAGQGCWPACEQGQAGLLEAAEARHAAPGDGSVICRTGAHPHPHEKHPLAEEPLIDMDAFPADLMVELAVGRVLRLRRGEQAEMRSGRDPRRVWLEVDRLIPGGYGFTYLQDGPDRWRMQVTRRPAV
jgi:uncharacterized protein (DUF2249 family)